MAASPPKSIPEIFSDLWELLKAYAKQETVDPLKPLGSKLKFGVPGGFLLAFGGFFLALGLLRGLQQIEQMQGFWSFGPYFVVAVALGLWSWLLYRMITKKPAPVAAAVKGAAKVDTREEGTAS